MRMSYKWAVVGAGPAGIASVARLIDSGLAAEDIVWIDPFFTVGDFGTLWRHVPSNTKVGLFLEFLHASPAFNFTAIQHRFDLTRLPPDNTCHLHHMAEPLQWITDNLRQNVVSLTDCVQTLSPGKNGWNLVLKTGEPLFSKNVILAVGSEPKTLNYPGVDTIPLQAAMDMHRITDHLSTDDTVAVFGSSHSAILVLKNLIAHRIERVINFYRSPLRYAIAQQDYILFDDTGLKGTTAIWARQHIGKTLPPNLVRYPSNDETIQQWLPICNKAVYAIGFQRRSGLLNEAEGDGYLDECGVIAPGLFGIGIAYPEVGVNPLGIKEHRIGLWKFMDYLSRILPIWLKYPA